MLPLFARDQSAAYLAGATEILRLTIEERGSRLHLSGAVFDLATQQKTQYFTSDTELDSGFLPSLQKFAHQIDPNGAQRFSTANLAALKPFTEAAVAQSIEARTQLLQIALTADPSFGLARIALAESVGEPALENVNSKSFTPYDKARWNALSARLKGSPPEVLIADQRSILKIAPNNVDALATLGSLLYKGDQREGERLLKRAINLNPANLGLRLQLQRLQQPSGAHLAK